MNVQEKEIWLEFVNAAKIGDTTEWNSTNKAVVAANNYIIELSAHVELLKGELAQIYMHEFGYSYDDAVKQVELAFTTREKGE
jgi:hypothetical protein